MEINMRKNNDSFHYKSLQIFLHPEVYEPAEDTFLLLDSIAIQPNNSILEIGAGTGIISLYYASIGATVVCSDINPYAIDLIRKNIKQNKQRIQGTLEVRKGNMFDIIRKNEIFDVIVFNPPYLPTTAEEKKGMNIWYTKSFDGGPTGLNTSLQFITQVKSYLTKQGKAYILLSSFTNKDHFEQTIIKSSLHFTIQNQLRCDDEILYVYQLFR